MNAPASPRFAAAVAAKGRLGAHRWLLLRRLSQLLILAAFLVGPLAGWWLVKGNLSYSLTLNTLPLTDPLLALQVLASGHLPEGMALLGALLVVLLYLLVGGRAYCAWVCPMNAVTDLAGWLREHLGLKGSAHISRQARYWLLGLTLLLPLAGAGLAWELVNPVSMLHRGLIFGMGAGWTVILAIFLFDLLVMSRGWCGHLCPMGAAYSLLGKASLLRVSARQRSACDDCMDCFAVCPEPQVIRPALKGEAQGRGPVINASACTNCGRCIDVCAKDVFVFGSRFNQRTTTPAGEAGSRS